MQYSTSNTVNSIFKSLEKYDEICFLNVGEMGWEIFIISPIVKLFKKTFPNKKVFIATRENRKELYNYLDDYFYFNIPGDYKTVTPRTNTLKATPTDKAGRPNDLNTDKIFTTLKESIKVKYPNVFFFSFENLPFMPNPDLNFLEFDFSFNVDPINTEIINNIINKYSDKKIVTMFPRHRVDLAHRNWKESSWKSLYKKLDEETDFLFFISGSSPSYIKPPKKYKNMITLEDLITNYPKASILGLTIEALKRSEFSFGPQTAGILISNILKIPTIYFGKEEILVSEKYNPFQNSFKFINVKYNSDYSYEISVDELYKNIVNYKEGLNRTLSINKKPEVVEEYTFSLPKKHPLLEGLEGEAYSDMLRQINLNPSHYSSGILKATKIVKKII